MSAFDKSLACATFCAASQQKKRDAAIKDRNATISIIVRYIRKSSERTREIFVYIGRLSISFSSHVRLRTV